MTIIGKKRRIPFAPPPHTLHSGECTACLQQHATPRASFHESRFAHRFNLPSIASRAIHSAKQDLCENNYPICRCGWDTSELPTILPDEASQSKETVHPVEMANDLESLGLAQRTNAFSQAQQKQMAEILEHGIPVVPDAYHFQESNLGLHGPRNFAASLPIPFSSTR